MEKHITLGMAYKWAMDAVRERGEDFVYVGSQYQPTPTMCVNTCVIDGDTVAACIVGKILVDGVGVPLEFFEREDSLGTNLSHLDFPGVAQELAYAYGMRFDSEAGTFLRRLQYKQDFGLPWGQAVVEARAYVEHSLS
jgi:hypothetical protein